MHDNLRGDKLGNSDVYLGYLQLNHSVHNSHPSMESYVSQSTYHYILFHFERIHVVHQEIIILKRIKSLTQKLSMLLSFNNITFVLFKL